MKRITENDLINLCIKFFFAHRNPESSDQSIWLKEIERFYSVGLRYFTLQRKGYQEFETKVLWIEGDVRYFIQNWYGAAMLWDIAPSVEVFKSIVEEVLSPKSFNRQYVGLDLWTGTWWLMLAQYINARRSGFYDIDIYWVERDEPMVRSTIDLFSRFPWKKHMESWKVLHWDTVENLSVYDLLSTYIAERKITYVSNENIPTCQIQMTGENDPFFQNVFNLEVMLWDKLTEVTKWFPKRIETLLTIQWEERVPIQWDFQSRYGLPKLLKMNDVLYGETRLQAGALTDLRILESVAPHGIDVWNGEIEWLTTIGRSLESRPWKGWKVYPQKWWRKRWDW